MGTTRLWQGGCTNSHQNSLQGVSRMNALKLLKKDHATVQNLFSKFDRTGKTSHEKKNELFVQIRRELQIHSKAEEEIFFPALKSLNGDGRRLVSEALKEHKDIDRLLLQIARLTPADKNFDEKVETL